jgi:hypothetical protein
MKAKGILTDEEIIANKIQKELAVKQRIKGEDFENRYLRLVNKRSHKV